jgi:hypothetical protein
VLRRRERRTSMLGRTLPDAIWSWCWSPLHSPSVLHKTCHLGRQRSLEQSWTGEIRWRKRSSIVGRSPRASAQDGVSMWSGFIMSSLTCQGRRRTSCTYSRPSERVRVASRNVPRRLAHEPTRVVPVRSTKDGIWRERPVGHD